QTWRDEHGQVEIKVAPQDRHHVEAVRLLNKVYMDEVSRRGETGTCLMTPVIEGPATASFSSGTAFVSYYLGQYDLLVKTEGEKGGKEGMEKYLCGTYFPVTKVGGKRYFPVVKDDGPTTRWEETGDFKVTWKGEEVWLVTELRHFCELAVAKKKGGRWAQIRGWTCRASSRTSEESRSLYQVDEAIPQGPLGFGTLSNPLGSKRFEEGSVRFKNATQVCNR
ncbi:unnamed protein product, partial [Ectocarpus sp. 4 AP-2014]